MRRQTSPETSPDKIIMATIPSLSCRNEQSDCSDVMMEIFSRLPFKSLLKFKRVCKWWYHLISDPIFITNYTRHNPRYQVLGLFLQKFFYDKICPELEFIPLAGEIKAAPKPSFSFIKDEDGVCIQHSCNGLLLCTSFRCHKKYRKYYVCKPTTKQYITLPMPEWENNIIGMNIAFDLESSTHYQVICVFSLESSSQQCQIKIYNSDTRSWKYSGEPFVASLEDDLLFERGVYWKGSLHWIGKKKLALRFNIGHEVLLPMPMPPIDKGMDERKLLYFGASGGHLYLIQFNFQDTVFDVLEMEGDYSGWFVKYHVNVFEMVNSYPNMDRENLNIYPRYSAVCFVRRYAISVLDLVHPPRVRRKEEEPFMILHIPHKFIKYNLITNTFKEFPDIPPRLMAIDRLKYTWERVFPYTKTLLSNDGFILF